LVLFLTDAAPSAIYTLSLHDALPIYAFGKCVVHLAGLFPQPELAARHVPRHALGAGADECELPVVDRPGPVHRDERDEAAFHERSEEHTSELQSLAYLVCRLLLEKKK